VQLHELYRGLLGEDETKILNLVIKGDVMGTVQALEGSLEKLSDRLEEVDVNIISSGIGDVTESDIMLAVASEAVVVGYNVQADEAVRRVAEDDHVEIRLYNVIYQILEDIELAAEGMLEPVFEEQFIGRAQVLQLFRISRLGVVAGVRITDGHLARNARLVVQRGNETVYEGTLDSLRRFENDVPRVESPNECGILLREFRGWEEGDVIEAFAMVEVERRPAASAPASNG
jgi:translation initiation factor IF-2